MTDSVITAILVMAGGIAEVVITRKVDLLISKNTTWREELRSTQERLRLCEERDAKKDNEIGMLKLRIVTLQYRLGIGIEGTGTGDKDKDTEENEEK